MNDEQLVLQVELAVIKSMDSDINSLEDICNTIYISRSQLHRRIKKQTGLSISRFIRKVRLQKAKELIGIHDYTINELTTIVGMSNPQNFSKYFKQEYGMTPSEMKVLIQKEL